MTDTTTTDRTWEIVKTIRAQVLSIVDEMVDNALGQLDSCEGHALTFPIARAAEWDWFFVLSAHDRNRLARRWFAADGVGPDTVADAMHTDIDTAMREWLRLTRIVEVGSDLRRRKHGGYVPRVGILCGQDLNHLFPDTGHDLHQLLSAQPTCTEYVANLSDEEEWTAADLAAAVFAAMSDLEDA